MGRKSTIGKLKPVLSRSFPFDRAQDERLSSWIVTYPGPFVVSHRTMEWVFSHGLAQPEGSKTV